MNQEVLAYLRASTSFAQLDWPNMLPSTQLPINNRDSSVSGLSPFFLENGYHIEPIQQVLLQEKAPISALERRTDRFMNRLKEAHEYATVARASAQQLMEDRAINTHNPSPWFREDDKVRLNLKNIKTLQPQNFLAWLNAKYTITKIISTHVVELDIPSKMRQIFHVQLLRKAGDAPLPSPKKDDEKPPPIIHEKFNNETDHKAPEQYPERILRPKHICSGKK